MRPRVKVLPLFSTTYHHFSTFGQALAFRTRTECREPLSDEVAGATWLTIDQLAGQAHICVFVNVAWHEGRGQAELESTLVHEAVHAAAMTLDRIEQGYDGRSEVLPYLVEMIHRWLKEGHA